MRVFAVSVIAAVLLATAFWFGLSGLQESTADAYSTSGVRLDQQEAVNIYGREPG
jgi:hypothetical protein